MIGGFLSVKFILVMISLLSYFLILAMKKTREFSVALSFRESGPFTQQIKFHNLSKYCFAWTKSIDVDSLTFFIASTSLKIDLQFFNYKFVAAMFESLYKALIHVLKYDSRNHLTKFVLLSYEITLLSNTLHACFHS